MVLLGMRTRGSTRSFSSLGRESFATNLIWKDGWPIVEPVELNNLVKPPVYSVNFSENAAPFGSASELISPRSFPKNLCQVTPLGIKMVGSGKGLDQESPDFIGRRQRRFDSLNQVSFSADTSNVRAGLSVRYDETSHYDIEYANGKIIARSAISYINHEVVADSPDIDETNIQLYAEMGPPGPTFFEGATSDLIHLGYLDRTGKKTEVAVFDGRYLSAEVTISFTGRVIGFYVVDGEITVQEFSETAAVET
jgi:hypothetical protein